jgi:hypothetical protein
MLTDLRHVCVCDYGFMNVCYPLTEYEELPSILWLPISISVFTEYKTEELNKRSKRSL